MERSSQFQRRPIRVLELSGSPPERGRHHGSSYAAEIRAYAEERIRLSYEGTWAGQQAHRRAALELAQECLPAHEAYAPDLFEEMVATGDAAGLSPAEMVVVGGFTDFVDVVRARLGAAPFEDTCTAFIVSDESAEGNGFLGQTWDMHDTAEPFVVMVRIEPSDGPKALVYSTVGCLGQMGLNEAGIAVGINNLSADNGRPGVTWPLVVRKALQQCDLDDALRCVLDAELAGAHNYLLFDRNGRGFSVEAMPDHLYVEPLEDDVLVHTNHCLTPETRAVEAPRPPELEASSEARLRRAEELLKERPVRPGSLFELTRDETICREGGPPYYAATCGAAIMRPATGDVWATWGLPSQYEYEHFTL